MNDTDQAKLDNAFGEDWDGAPERDPEVSCPEFPGNPHNHRYTISMDGRGPMVVIRGNTAEEINAAADELRETTVGAMLGSFWQEFKAAAMVANGLGGATPVPAQAGPPAPPQGAPTPPPFGQNVSVPQAPGYVGPPQAPAPQWGGQQQGGGQSNRAEPKPRPAWPQVFRISIRRGDNSFKEYRGQNAQYFKGKVQWAGGGDYWIHGDVVQSVTNWNPTPA
jgi:hypothetical protein